MSLAYHVAMANWNDQEIGNTITAFYRKHQSSGKFEKPPSMKKATRIDYLARTIAKARKSADFSKNILECLRLNEDGDARLFVQENRNKFAYDHSEGCWYVYRGPYWEITLMALSIFVDLTPGLTGSSLELLHFPKADGVAHARLNAQRMLPEGHSIVAQVPLWVKSIFLSNWH